MTIYALKMDKLDRERPDLYCLLYLNRGKPSPIYDNLPAQPPLLDLLTQPCANAKTLGHKLGEDYDKLTQKASTYDISFSKPATFPDITRLGSLDLVRFSEMSQKEKDEVVAAMRKGLSGR